MENGKLKIILSGGGTEGDLCTGQSAFAESLSQGGGVLGVIKDHHRNDTDLLDLF